MSKNNKKASTEIKQNANKPAPEITGANTVSAPGLKKAVLTAAEIEKAKADLAEMKAKEKALRELLKENKVSTKVQRGPSVNGFITEILNAAPENDKPKAQDIARLIIVQHPELNPFTVCSTIQKFFRPKKEAAKDEPGTGGSTEEAK